MPNLPNAVSSHVFRGYSMDCTICKSKSCRNSVGCGAESFERDALISDYHETENQSIVSAAASLVDNGRAGTLSRVEETLLFIKQMGYKKPGLAYCFGMEREARLLRELFRSEGIKLEAVSCSVGGVNQNLINSSSCTEKVSCNPLGQADTLNAAGVDIVLIMGICLGHDILLHKHLKADFTTIVVKDRVHNHAPLLALNKQTA